MQRTTLVTVFLAVAAGVMIALPFIGIANAQLEPLADPEAPIVQATHLDVNNTTMLLHVPLTDPNGVTATAGALNVRINKSDLAGLSVQQKLNLRDVVVTLLQLKGVASNG